jgi:DNA-binding transcriptional ArsR family regulator
MTAPALTTRSPEIAAAAGSLTVPDMERIGRMGAEPELLEPTAPYLHPILEIHRGPDGFVCFGRKLDDDWQNLPAIPVDRLCSMFPAFVQQLLRDSFFTLNTFWKGRREYARYLNCCWVDIDLHAPGEFCTLGQRYGQVMDMAQAGTIPRPSITVYSGRGLWFLWLLIGDDGIPPRAYPEKKLAQEAINRELASRLGADQGASDVARMIRVPGSTNTKAEPGYEVVTYRFLMDLDGQMRGQEYTLNQLAAALDIQLPSLRHPRSAASERGLRGWNALYNQRYALFHQLLQIREAFQEGCRNRACLQYAIILRGYGMSDDAVRQELMRFGHKCCIPPLTTCEIEAAFGESRKSSGKVRNSTLSAHLMVTAEEGLLIPEWAPASQEKKAVTPVVNGNIAASIEFRKRLISEIVGHLGRVPSTRQMAQLLGERGVTISYPRVADDYKQLGLSSRRTSEFLLPTVTELNASREEGEGRESSLSAHIGEKLDVQSVQPAEAYQEQENYQVVS